MVSNLDPASNSTTVSMLSTCGKKEAARAQHKYDDENRALAEAGVKTADALFIALRTCMSSRAMAVRARTPPT